MEEIVESIYNGQRRQALKQIAESDYIFEDCLKYIAENISCEEAIVMVHIAISQNYISFNPANLRY